MKTLYAGGYLDLHEADNGHVFVCPKDAVAVLVYNEGQRTLAMILQDRTPLQYRGMAVEPLLEIPAGGIERGESIEAAAIREVREEVGYNISGDYKSGRNFHLDENPKRIASVFASPGYSTEQLHIFLALVRDSDRVDRNEDEGTAIELKTHTVYDMLAQGMIRDAKTLIALQRFFPGDAQL